MSALVPTTPTWQWSPEVLQFAASRQVAPYLDPFLEATRKVFPTARELKVFVEADRELRDVTWIVFEAYVPQVDIPNYLDAKHRWSDELGRICPGPLVTTFALTLIPVV
jgi:hypothetical protein